MSSLFRFPEAVDRSPEVDGWMRWQKGELGTIAREWWETLRSAGRDVRELLHDGHPTACHTDAAFAYVDSFRAHINIGFYYGAALPDPAGLLQGTGKSMRHVKIRPGEAVNRPALLELIRAAHGDIRRRVENER